MKHPLFAVAALSVATLLAASAAPTPAVRPKDVVAATFPAADWARQIVGSHTNAVRVSLLQKGGADLHSYRPSAADVAHILRSDLFIHVGGESDVWACAGLSAAVVAFCAWTHHQSLEYAFDEDFARVEGGRVRLYNVLSALVVAVVVSVAIRLVGALLVFPAASALRIFRSYRAVVVFAALLAGATALAGILVSVLAGTPVGATVIAMDMLAFAACWLAGRRGVRT